MRPLRHHVRQHRRGAPGGGRPHLAPHHAQQRSRGAFRCLPLVDMRIRLIAGDDLRVAHHCVEEVGVHVVGHTDRRLRIDRADATQQFALAVVEPVGDHGAMQVEPQRIKAALCHRVGDHAAARLVGLAVHRSTRRRAGTDRHHHFGADLVRHRQIAAHARTGAAIEIDRRLAAQQCRAVATEALQPGGDWRERVGLVRQGCQQQPHRFPLVFRSASIGPHAAR